MAPTFEASLAIYLEELERWNRLAGLTAYRGVGARIRHLVLESLLLLRVLPEPAAPLLDIGSGAGVPGLVLKLARPDWRVTLIEASRRRANFLRHTVRRLGLDDIVVHHGRAEALASSPEHHGRYRTVILRAVARPGAAMVLGRPFVGAEGHLVIPMAPGVDWKGPGICEASFPPGPGALPLRRRFLVVTPADIPGSVSRGTSASGHEPHRRRGQPEGRCRKDDDGRQPGGGTGHR